MIGLSQASPFGLHPLLPRAPSTSATDGYTCDSTQVSILNAFRTLVTTKLNLTQTQNGGIVREPGSNLPSGLVRLPDTIPPSDQYGNGPPPTVVSDSPGDKMWEDYFAQSDSNFVQGVYQQMMQAQPVERCASVTNIHCDANRFWDDFTQSFCPAFFADAVKSNVTAAVLQDAATCTDAQNDDGIQSKLRSLAMMTWLASSINVTSLLSNTTAPPFHVQKDGHLLAGIQDGHSTCTTHSCITGITNAIGNGDQTRTNTQYYYGTYVLYAQDFYAVSGYCANNQTAAAVTGGSAPPGVAAASSGNSSASGFSSSAGQTTNRNTSSVNGGVPAGFTGP